MKKLRVGINGMGRIGRTLIREWLERNRTEIEVVAVNNPGNINMYTHLLKYDTIHGTFDEDISCEDGQFLKIGNKTIHFASERNPSDIPWGSWDIDVVIDATGVFKDQKGLGGHLKSGAKKVIMCAPGKDLDGTFVMGINHQEYDNSKHHIVSNASCTTNCLAPVAKVLDQQFGILKGQMVTVHAYTSDQNLLDGSHSKDFRRARAAACSMIPTSTGAAKALGDVLPNLKGKLDGYAVRVPTPDVSMVDLTVQLKCTPSQAEINNALKEASSKDLKGILACSDLDLVSSDFRGTPQSAIVDTKLTKCIDDCVKVVAWYDNEVGFSNRVLDLATYMGEKL